MAKKVAAECAPRKPKGQHVYHHFDEEFMCHLKSNNAKLEAILEGVCQLTNKVEHLEERVMASLDDAIAKIAEQKTLIGSVKELIASLKQQIADALSGVTLPPGVQAKVDAVFDGLNQNDAELADAIVAKTPNET